MGAVGSHTYDQAMASLLRYHNAGPKADRGAFAPLIVSARSDGRHSRADDNDFTGERFNSDANGCGRCLWQVARIRIPRSFRE